MPIIEKQESETENTDASGSHPWRGFQPGDWQNEVDVRAFIQANYKPYTEDYSFLTGPTARTEKLWDELKVLLKQELDAGGVLDADEKIVSKVASHGAGYINKDLEQVVGVQTDKPLKRGMLPYGGYRIAQKALQAHGRDMDPTTLDIFQAIN